MPTPIQEFYRICRKEGLGGPFIPPPEQAEIFAAREQIFNVWTSLVRKRVKPGKILPDIQLKFLADGRFNGIATYRQGIPFIGLTRGAVLLPYDLFHRMLSHPAILPEIGNPALEQIDAQHADGVLSDFSDIETLRTNRPYFLRDPIDPVRREFAKLCTLIAADFLLLHEIAHISHGHVQPQAASPRPFIMETALAHGVSPSLAINSQALEMDADSSAGSMTFAHFVKADADGEMRAFPWAVAIGGLFHIWGMGLDKNNLHQQHPPTALRYVMALGLAHTLVLSKPSPFSDKIHAAIGAGSTAVWKGLHFLGVSDAKDRLERFLNALSDPTVAQHRCEIFSEWDRIRDQLEASSITGVAPKRTDAERRAQEDRAKNLSSPKP